MLEKELSLGFIGFGEAAFGITMGLKSEGFKHITSYDKAYQQPPQSKIITERAKTAEIELLPSVEKVLEVSDMVISATSASEAVNVANAAAPFLSKNNIFVDVNAACPDTIIEVSNILKKSECIFVDVAMMADVKSNRHKVPMFVSGPGAERFEKLMSPFGMNIRIVGEAPGQASSIKMVRSVFTKGLEALLMEAFTAAQEYRIVDLTMENLAKSMDNTTFEKRAAVLLGKTAIHSARRIHEMEDVIKTLNSLGVDPIMSKATLENFIRIERLGLNEYFSGETPEDYKKVLEAVSVSKKSN
jgi:3-hydroxyisobutyrate dehydrogenase-like beta-hydroxyacid dehydrogenase